MEDIVKRLRGITNDRDNFPHMNTERWLPVELAKEAANEIEQLRKQSDPMMRTTKVLRRTEGDGDPFNTGWNAALEEVATEINRLRKYWS